MDWVADIRGICTQCADRNFQYTQVDRQGNLAIFAQQHKANPAVVRYEVVRIRVEPETRWPDGAVTPAREVYPRAASWGTWGWTCFSLDEGKALLAQLQARAVA